MGLSAQTIAKLEAAKEAVNEFYERRLQEVDSQAAALRDTDVSVSSLTLLSSEEVSSKALETIASVVS